LEEQDREPPWSAAVTVLYGRQAGSLDPRRVPSVHLVRTRWLRASKRSSLTRALAPRTIREPTELGGISFQKESKSTMNNDRRLLTSVFISMLVAMQACATRENAAGPIAQSVDSGSASQDGVGDASADATMDAGNRAPPTCPGSCQMGTGGNSVSCDFNAVCVSVGDASPCAFGVQDWVPCGCFGCGQGCSCADSAHQVCACP
jgi:hypothetical protein